MPEKMEKVFESATLLKVFNGRGHNGEIAGRFTTERIDHNAGVLPPKYVTEPHTVYAETVVLWCENYRLAIVEQNVYISNGYGDAVPEWHFYRSSDLPKITLIRGAHNSAELMREILGHSRDWKLVLAEHVPPNTYLPRPETTESILDAVRAEAAKEGFTVGEHGELIHNDDVAELHAEQTAEAAAIEADNTPLDEEPAEYAAVATAGDFSGLAEVEAMTPAAGD